jgi:hypothetical protein
MLVIIPPPLKLLSQELCVLPAHSCSRLSPMYAYSGYKLGKPLYEQNLALYAIYKHSYASASMLLAFVPLAFVRSCVCTYVCSYAHILCLSCFYALCVRALCFISYAFGPMAYYRRPPF